MDDQRPFSGRRSTAGRSSPAGISTPRTSGCRACGTAKCSRPPSYDATLTSVEPRRRQVDARRGRRPRRRTSSAWSRRASDLASRALAAIKASGSPVRDLRQGPVPRAEAAGRIAAVRRGGRGGSGGNAGSIADGPEGGGRPLEQTYTIAYIAHAPLEPRAAVAEWKDGKLTVWTGHAAPVRRARRAGRGLSGFRRGPRAGHRARHRRRLWRQAHGRGGRRGGSAGPRGRPAGQARLDPRGGVHLGLLPPRGRHRRQGRRDARTARSPPGSSTTTIRAARASRTRTHVRNQLDRLPSVAFAACARALIGRWRPRPTTSPASRTSTSWPCAIGIDPLEFRLKNLKDERLRAVLEAAAKSFGWGRKPGPDCGVGIAVGLRKGGFIATCAEVSVDRSSGRVQVVRARSAFDCGAVVNPDHLKNQVEGAMIMGLGGALFEAIEFDGGRIQNPQVLEVPRAAVPRRARDRGRVDRPQGRAVGRRRRDPDRRHRAGYRQRDLRRCRSAAAVDAHGAQWAEALSDPDVPRGSPGAGPRPSRVGPGSDGPRPGGLGRMGRLITKARRRLAKPAGAVDGTRKTRKTRRRTGRSARPVGQGRSANCFRSRCSVPGGSARRLRGKIDVPGDRHTESRTDDVIRRGDFRFGAQRSRRGF